MTAEKIRIVLFEKLTPKVKESTENSIHRELLVGKDLLLEEQILGKSLL